MFLANNLKYLRLKNNFSQDYVAGKLGYKSYTTIQKWEMGTSEPPISKLDALSKMYNIDMDTIYTVNLEYQDCTTNKDFTKYPLLGTIAAGSPLLAEENIEDYFAIDSRVRADFALRVKGDSMINAGIYENDIVFIRRQETIENGEIGAILIENEATLKRFYKDEKAVVLQAENDAFKPMVFTNGNIKVLGKLVAVLNIKD